MPYLLYFLSTDCNVWMLRLNAQCNSTCVLCCTMYPGSMVASHATHTLCHTLHTPTLTPLSLSLSLSLSQLLSTGHGSLASSSDIPSRGMPYTSELAAASTPHTSESLVPCYQVLNSEGRIIDPSQDPQVEVVYLCVIENEAWEERGRREGGGREREKEYECPFVHIS